MELLVWAGGGLSLLGLLGLIWCVIKVLRAKRQATSDEELRAVLQKVLPLNLGTLGLSVIGLMLVMVGLVLS